MLRHRGCGGEVKPVPGDGYEYEGEDGKMRYEARLVCDKCEQEITGDPQVDIVVDGEVVDVNSEWRDSGD